MYEYITQLSELKNFQESLTNLKEYSCGFDTETTGLSIYTDRVLLIQIELDGKVFLFDTDKLGNKNIIYILELIKNKGISLIGFNLKFDLKFIKYIYGVLFTKVIDIQFAEIISTNGLGTKFPSLDDVTLKYLNIQLDKSIREHFYKDFKGFIEADLIYSSEDVLHLKELLLKIETILYEQKQLKVFEMENRLLPVVAMMELEGVYLDKDEWLKLEVNAIAKRDRLNEEIKDYIIDEVDTSKFESAQDLAVAMGIVPKLVRDKKLLAEIAPQYALQSWIKDRLLVTSPLQMRNILNLLGVPVADTNDDTLVLYPSHPLVSLIRDFREADKKRSTYGTSWLEYINPVTGRVHSKFHQLGTTTGRFSSSDLDLQNIPKLAEYRACFKARPGYKLIRADYNQQEYRLVGEISGDETIINAYKEGKDMHTATAALVNDCKLEEVTKDQRDVAKNINFATIYMSSAYGLSMKMHIPLEKAEDVIYKLNHGYPQMVEFRSKFSKRVFEIGYSKTLAGRKRFFTKRGFYEGGADEFKKERNKIMRWGYNCLIQGTGAEIIKEAMINFFYTNPFSYEEAHLLLQVHDELVFEVKEELVELASKFIEETMLNAERGYLKKIPSKVELTVSDYWSK